MSRKRKERTVTGGLELPISADEDIVLEMAARAQDAAERAAQAARRASRAARKARRAAEDALSAAAMVRRFSNTIPRPKD